MIHKLCHRIQGECTGGLATSQRQVLAHHQRDRQVGRSPGSWEEGASRRADAFRLAEHGEVGEVGVVDGRGVGEGAKGCGDGTVFTNLKYGFFIKI